MAENDSDTGSQVDLGTYIDGNPFYLLFSDQEAMSTLFDLRRVGPITATDFAAHQTMGDPDTDDISRAKDLLEFLYDLELLLKEDSSTPTYEINQAHSLNKALEAPHMRHLTGDNIAAGLLTCYLDQRYLPCIDAETLVDLTDFPEPAVEEGIERLNRRRLIRPSMAIQGDKSKDQTVDRAHNLLETATELIDAADDETIDLDATALRDILHGRPEEGDEHTDELFLISGDELRHAVRVHATQGYPALEATNHIFAGDEPQKGYTINREHEATDHLYTASMRLVEYTQQIQEWYESDPTEDPDDQNEPMFSRLQRDPEMIVDHLESLLDTYFADSRGACKNAEGNVLIYVEQHPDTDVVAELKETADEVLPEGYVVDIEPAEGPLPDSVPAEMRSRLRLSRR